MPWPFKPYDWSKNSRRLLRCGGFSAIFSRSDIFWPEQENRTLIELCSLGKASLIVPMHCLICATAVDEITLSHNLCAVWLSVKYTKDTKSRAWWETTSYLLHTSLEKDRHSNHAVASLEFCPIELRGRVGHAEDPDATSHVLDSSTFLFMLQSIEYCILWKTVGKYCLQGYSKTLWVHPALLAGKNSLIARTYAFWAKSSPYHIMHH